MQLLMLVFAFGGSLLMQTTDINKKKKEKHKQGIIISILASVVVFGETRLSKADVLSLNQPWMATITVMFFTLYICVSHMLVTNLLQLHPQINPLDSRNALSRKTWRDVALTCLRVHLDVAHQYCVNDNFPTCHCASVSSHDAYILCICHRAAVWRGDWHSKLSSPVRRCQRFIMPEYFSTLGAANYEKRWTEIKVYLKSTGRSLRKKKKAQKFIFMIPQSVCGRCPSLTVMVFRSFKKRSLRHRLGSSPDSGTNTSLMGTNIPLGIRH